jgi:hypothetical protein
MNQTALYYKQYNSVPSLLELCYDFVEFNFDALPPAETLHGDHVALLLPELLTRRKRGSSTLNENNISKFFSSDLYSLDLQSFWYVMHSSCSSQL